MAEDKIVTLSKGINKAELNELLDRLEINATQIDQIIDEISKRFCSSLDKLMTKIKELVYDKAYTITDEELDYLVLQLPCEMYFTSNSQEDLGLREDISKALEKEIYHQTLLETTGTVSQKESTALLKSQHQALITSINSRVYKKIKTRMDYALETLGSLKKVLQHRISSMELSGRDKN